MVMLMAPLVAVCAAAEPRVTSTDTLKAGHIEFDIGVGFTRATAEVDGPGATIDASVLSTEMAPAIYFWAADHFALGASVPFQLSRSVDDGRATSDGPTGAGDLGLALLYGRRAAPWLRTLAEMSVRLPTGSEELSAEAAQVAWGGTLEFRLTDAVGLAVGLDYTLRTQGDLPADPGDAFDVQVGLPYRTENLHVEPALVLAHTFADEGADDGSDAIAAQVNAGYSVAPGVSITGLIGYARLLEQTVAPGISRQGDAVSITLGLQYVTPKLW
ncbi:MAG: hypothetical protein KC583_13885 [Myxococcales bacterium]|nr:hypothetical protein [Myxococcales bacterium]